MKKLLFAATLFVIALTSCQKNQYAFVQKGKAEVFVQKTRPQAIVLQEMYSPTISEFTETAATEKDIAMESTVANKESLNSEAASSDLSFNQDYVNQEFAALNRVESFVSTNENVDVQKVEEIALLDNINLEKDTSTSILTGDTLPLNIPAFWWGCFLGGLGILAVYIITEDKAQTTKAVYGCLTLGAVIVAFYVVVIVAGLTSTY